MAENSIIVNNNVGIVEYSAAVFEIASKFFDEDGNYTPHFGRINSVGVFFKYFVDEDSFEKYLVENGHDLDSFGGDNSWVELILGDETLSKLYNEAFGETYIPGFALNFANAYLDATNIVEYKKNSMENAIENVGKMIQSIIENLDKYLSGTNLDKVFSIASMFAKNGITEADVVEEYFNSDRFKKLMEAPITELPQKKG